MAISSTFPRTAETEILPLIHWCVFACSDYFRLVFPTVVIACERQRFEAWLERGRERKIKDKGATVRLTDNGYPEADQEHTLVATNQVTRQQRESERQRSPRAHDREHRTSFVQQQYLFDWLFSVVQQQYLLDWLLLGRVRFIKQQHLLLRRNLEHRLFLSKGGHVRTRAINYYARSDQEDTSKKCPYDWKARHRCLPFQSCRSSSTCPEPDLGEEFFYFVFFLKKQIFFFKKTPASCLSGTCWVYIFSLSLAPLLIIDLAWHLSFPFLGLHLFLFFWK